MKKLIKSVMKAARCSWLCAEGRHNLCNGTRRVIQRRRLVSTGPLRDVMAMVPCEDDCHKARPRGASR